MKPMQLLVTALLLAGVSAPAMAQTMFPANGASGVNPDAQLKLTFSSPPTVGTSGKIRVYDAATNKLVDTLDLSLKPGPTERAVEPATSAPYLDEKMKGGYPYARKARATNATTRPGTPSAGAQSPPAGYQLSIIGGFTDGFHFYPVLVKDNTATIQLHHDLLAYGKTYRVEIDPGVITVADGAFKGVTGKSWSFTTKAKSAAPKAGATKLTVAADGSGDFNTVQGALDFVPDHSKTRVTINVRPGVYQEIVYARNKDNVTLVGDGEDKTRITYANNEVFNPHPDNLRTNERPGTFPSRRAAVSLDNVSDVHIVNMTIETTSPGQAEGLLLNGNRNIVDRVTIIGAGDALQVNGPAYFVDTTLVGTGDTILGRGPSFWENCTIKSTRVLMWIRNTDKNHGNVFNDCTFIGTAPEATTIARSPNNGKAKYPHAEAVLLNTTLQNIAPEGWGAAHDGGEARFWEFNSRNPDGSPADVSKRAPWSKVLDAEKDAKTIADYSKPEFVLGGWKPVVSVPRPKK